MRRRIGAVLAAGTTLALAPAPAAFALCPDNHAPDGVHTHRGSCVHLYVGESTLFDPLIGCGFAGAAVDGGDPDMPHAVNGVLWSTTGVRNPPGAAVTVVCSVRRGWTTVASAAFSGIGAAVGAARAGFVASPDDFLTICTSLTVNNTSRGTNCISAVEYVGAPSFDLSDVEPPDVEPSPPCDGAPSILLTPCVVRVETVSGGAISGPGTTVTIPQTCNAFCIGPFSQTISPAVVPLPDAVPGVVVTMYYQRSCYYVDSRGQVTSRAASAPADC